MVDWSPFQETFLSEMLRLEGLRGSDINICPHCHAGDAVIRCRDCDRGPLMCQVCCLHEHSGHPFHRVQVSRMNGFLFFDS